MKSSYKALKEKYEIEVQISKRYEEAIKALMDGEITAYNMIRAALKFAKEQRGG